MVVVAGAGEVDAPAIAQQAAGEQLVVDVQRGCAQVLEVCHGGGVVGLATPASKVVEGIVTSGRRGIRSTVATRCFAFELAHRGTIYMHAVPST